MYFCRDACAVGQNLNEFGVVFSLGDFEGREFKEAFLGLSFLFMHLDRDLLWPEATEYAILIEIFQRLGTPNEANWPGVSKLPHFSKDFPKWSCPTAAKAFPGLKGTALDLLAVS